MFCHCGDAENGFYQSFSAAEQACADQSADGGYGSCLAVQMGFVSIKTLLPKDTNRKVRRTEFIYICGSKNGSSSSAVNTGEVWGDVSRAQKCTCLAGIWNQNSNTVIFEKCCSYLSISVFN